MSSSSTKEIKEPMILCSRCKANVELKEKLCHVGIPQQVLTAAMKPQHVLGISQCHKVFDRLGPQVQDTKLSSTR
ncbi:hypothetical protein ACFX2I_035775 [Malus domestica]